MVVLSQINQMKSQGFSTAQIIQSLKEQGHSPRDINEALSQSEIKREVVQRPVALANEYGDMSEMQPSIESQMASQMQMPPGQRNQGYQAGFQTGGQFQSGIPEPTQEYSPQQEPVEYQPQEQMPYPDQELTQSVQQQAYYPEYSTQQPADFETISDITTQIIEEKMDTMKKELDNFTKFRKHTAEQIHLIEKKLDKLDDAMNQLQLSIIRKVGEYGEDIKNISEEMRATQDSFSKIINPLTENLKELRKISEMPESEPETQKESESKKQKNKSNFEDYLR